jgi:pilus assembly protein CpaB
VLSVLWLGQNDAGTTVAQVEKIEDRTAILVATRVIAAGSPVLRSDMQWKELQGPETNSGTLVRGQISEAEFVGAITRRSFAEGEPLTSDDLVKTGDRKFLAALLAPGKRAVAVPIESQQSASGLVLPGDRVDVILTHILLEAAGSLSGPVAETILRDVRVIAVDQTLTPAQKPTSADTALPVEARATRVVTLEVDEQQAQPLVVALQLGKLQLALRSLQSLPRAGRQPELPPTFASNISPALRELALKAIQVQPTSPQVQPTPPEVQPTPCQVQSTGSTLESLVRRPPVPNCTSAREAGV